MISDLSGVEAERKIWQERLDNVSARMNLIEQTGGDRKEWNRLDDIAGESRRALNSLSRAESQIRQGVSSEEALRQSSLEQSRVTRQVAEKQSQVEAGTFKGVKQRAIEARQLRSKTGSTPTPQGEKIIISASGGVRIGTSRYIGNTTIPNTGGMTANDFVRQQRLEAIKQGVIDKKDYGRATLTITRTQPEAKKETRKVKLTSPMSQQVILPGGELPSARDFQLGGNEISVQNLFGQGEYYSSAMGMYGTPTLGGAGTSIFRFPTPKEKETFRQRDIKAGAIVSVPGQYLGTIFDKQLNQELADRGSKGNFIQRFGTFLSPSFQYDIAKYNEQLRLDSIEYTRNIAPKVDTAYKSLIASGVSKQQIKSGNITQQLTPVQEQAVLNYNMYVDFAMENKATQRLMEQNVNAWQRIADSNLSSGKKTALTYSLAFTKTAPYLFAPTRAILGFDILQTGGKALETAETKGQKALAGGQIVLGGAIAYSGIKGVYAGITGASVGTSITGTATKLKVIRYSLYGAGTGIAGGIGALDYYYKFKQTGDRDVALGSSLGTTSALLAGVWGPMAYEKATDYLRTRNLQQIYTPKIGDKPFIRATPSGKEQAVFYARTQAFKWYKPTTYKFYGTKPGQFYQRQYRIVDPLVEGKTKGYSSVTYYDVVKGKVVQKTAEVTSFPYDKPSRQMDWFLGKQQGVQQYYLPQKFLPSNIKGSVTGSGYSATPSRWNEAIPGIDQYQVYYSGKGASVYFFRSGNVEGSSLQVGGSPVAGNKPVLYSSYFEKVKDLPGKEIVVPNPLDSSAKGWKQYIFGSPTQQGTLYLPGFKQEVEGVVTGSRVDVGGFNFFKFGGRRIPIQTGAYFTQPTLTNLNIPSSSLTASRSSYVPSSSYAPNILNLGYAGLGGTSSTSSVSTTPSQVLSITPSYSSYVSSTPNYSITSSRVSSSGSRSYTSTPSISKAYSSIVSRPSKVTSKVSPSLSVSNLYSGISKTNVVRPVSYNPSKYLGFGGFKTKPMKMPKGFGKFQVLGRRRGKFKVVGVGRTEKEAFSLGKDWARRTLGRSFYVPKTQAKTIYPDFRTKVDKQGRVLYIQKTGKGAISTLGSPTERAEIKKFRQIAQPFGKKRKRTF